MARVGHFGMHGAEAQRRASGTSIRPCDALSGFLFFCLQPVDSLRLSEPGVEGPDENFPSHFDGAPPWYVWSTFPPS
jgi:hypothetical protein